MALTNNGIIGKRISMMRRERNINQQTLANELREFTNGTWEVTAINISSYETGNRNPTLENLIVLARYFNTTVDYMVGLTDDPYTSGEAVEKATNKDYSPLKPDTLIPYNCYSKYHEQPVFVVCPDTELHNRWALLDYHNSRLIFASEIRPITERTKLYCHVPFHAAYAGFNLPRPLNLTQLLDAETVWVELISTDRQACGKYNGWYRHNEDHSMIINCSNGLLLPYTGIGLSYNAYILNK